MPECDIYFEKENIEEEKKIGKKLNNKKENKKEIIHKNSEIEENLNEYGNNVCNIYNECGNKTNLKYIEPVKIRKLYDMKNESHQDDDIEEYSELNESLSDFVKIERDSCNPFNLNLNNLNTIPYDINKIAEKVKERENTYSFALRYSFQPS